MVYIDPETFYCYAEQNSDGTRIPHEDDFFDGKCKTFIEGYYCDQVKGEVYPWKPHTQLAAAQREYEQKKLAEYTEYLRILGVEV